MITLLDYGAGNVRSVRNAIRKLGCEVKNARNEADILQADKLIFPGVGSFGLVMGRLVADGFADPLAARIRENKHFLGICVALQALFEGSEDSPGVAGLSILPGQVKRFSDQSLSVPHIGWNDIKLKKECSLFNSYRQEKLYFVHSYHAQVSDVPDEWLLSTTDYGEEFVSGVGSGNCVAFQFHPEKSGFPGLDILEGFLKNDEIQIQPRKMDEPVAPTRLAKRIIACLDVRSNDSGDLVVTKGDQYDVREGGEVRIKRRDGTEFAVKPVASVGSPLDVPGVDTGLTREEMEQQEAVAVSRNGPCGSSLS